MTCLTLDPRDVETMMSIRAVKESNIVLTATLIALNMWCSKQARGFCRLINSDRLRCAHRCVIRAIPGFPPNECTKLQIFGS